MKHLILILLLGVTITSCTVKPEPINYGQDACHFCKMTIVDKVHAAEVVTHKGKVYKFDAAECMVNFMDDFDTAEIKLYLTNHFNDPETLIDATKATFLISKNVPSPMGAFLTAFKTKQEAEVVLEEQGGEIYTWDALLMHL
ncbi:nitrous oxide reductase accessory protein NosL [Xanthomarina sp. F2636L]|uniref:nitrous oxide reductase accessory protein NosL n=1 Tax=Xanthomarina sp. F2636L TaxID=2996018 RepID=UPI00225E245C|nr:nitrous oxide reductase accessory protein NosL [Xanthomarina sp. F2636L]MCX7550136.1 nitrous oxide reductase accessory protein NosL [Xanthomarina sp. F2636L]